MEQKDWMHASDAEIAQMTAEEAVALVQRQVDLGHSRGSDFKPRLHMTRAYEILLELALKQLAES